MWQFVLRVYVFVDGLLMMTVQLADTGAPLGAMRSNHLFCFLLLGSRSLRTFCIDVGVAVGGGGRFVRGLGRLVFSCLWTSPPSCCFSVLAFLSFGSISCSPNESFSSGVCCSVADAAFRVGVRCNCTDRACKAASLNTCVVPVAIASTALSDKNVLKRVR